MLGLNVALGEPWKRDWRRSATVGVAVVSFWPGYISSVRKTE